MRCTKPHIQSFTAYADVWLRAKVMEISAMWLGKDFTYRDTDPIPSNSLPPPPNFEILLIYYSLLRWYTVPVQPVIAPVGLGHLLRCLFPVPTFRDVGLRLRTVGAFETAKIASLCHKWRTSIVELLGDTQTPSTGDFIARSQITWPHCLCCCELWLLFADRRVLLLRWWLACDQLFLNDRCASCSVFWLPLSCYGEILLL